VRRARDARLARLARLAGCFKEPRSRESERRRRLSARVAAGALIRESLARRGLDPARAPALSLAESAAELAHDAPAPDRPSPAPDRDTPAERFAARIAAIAERLRERGEPDLARASLAELFAWCLCAPSACGKPPAPAARAYLVETAAKEPRARA
jgi:hypothetical protein